MNVSNKKISKIKKQKNQTIKPFKSINKKNNNNNNNNSFRKNKNINLRNKTLKYKKYILKKTSADKKLSTSESNETINDNPVSSVPSNPATVQPRNLFADDSIIQKVLAIIFTAAYFFLSYTMFKYFVMNTLELSDYEIGFISTVFGAMSSKVNTIIDFFFGGSSKK